MLQPCAKRRNNMQPLDDDDKKMLKRLLLFCLASTLVFTLLVVYVPCALPFIIFNAVIVSLNWGMLVYVILAVKLAWWEGASNAKTCKHVWKLEPTRHFKLKCTQCPAVYEGDIGKEPTVGKP